MQYLYVDGTKKEIIIDSEEDFLEMIKSCDINEHTILQNLDTYEWQRVSDFPELKRIIKTKKVKTCIRIKGEKPKNEGNILYFLLAMVLFGIGYSLSIIMAYYPEFFKLPTEITYLWGFSDSRSFLTFNLLIILFFNIIILISFPRARKGVALLIFGLLYIASNFTNFAVSAIQGYQDVGKSKYAQKEIVFMVKDFGIGKKIEKKNYSEEEYGERNVLMNRLSEFYAEIYRERENISLSLLSVDHNKMLKEDSVKNYAKLKENIVNINNKIIRLEDFEVFLRKSEFRNDELFNDMSYNIPNESEEMFWTKIREINKSHIRKLISYYKIRKMILEKEVDILNLLRVKNELFRVEEDYFLFKYQDDMDLFKLKIKELEIQNTVEESEREKMVRDLFESLRNITGIKIQID